jgi:hypothetical protein
MLQNITRRRFCTLAASTAVWSSQTLSYASRSAPSSSGESEDGRVSAGTTATVQPVTNPYGLNHSLGYLPWTQLLDGMDSASRGLIRENCLGQNEAPANTLQLSAGMKLIVEDVGIYQQGGIANGSFPGLARYEWVVPSDTFGPEDYFFLSYLLMSWQSTSASGSMPAPRQDLVQRLRDAIAVRATPDSTDFSQQVAKLVRPIFSSLQLVNVRSGEWSSTPGTSSRVREWLTQPSKIDFGTRAYPSPFNPNQSLRAKIPFGGPSGTELIEINAFQSGSAFYLDNVPAEKIDIPPHPNAWFSEKLSTIYRRRQLLQVLIPVRASQSAIAVPSAWQFVPIHYSIADVEQDWGIKCAGVRRRPDFVGCIKDKALSDIDPTSVVSQIDKRAGISFFSNSPVGASATLYVSDPKMKQDMLLAPGDILIVNP